ncbi:MAG: cyclopropane-fatty-acyl-phospholipid synthase [Motiliproteus sp.]|jgi:cyclopropane-fatty-acyl-phospholipid synthase
MEQQDLQAKAAASSLTESFDSERRAKPLAIRYLASKLEQLGVSRVRLVAESGNSWTIGRVDHDLAVPVITLHNKRALARGWFGGLMGWAEGFMAGDWSCHRLLDVTDWAMANETAFESAFDGGRISALLDRLYHLLHNNSRRGSRRNIAFHYDLGNEFYRLWLDPSMTYSSALFSHPDQSLADAQQHKYQRVLDLVAPEPHQSVLEIGCGWGGFGEALLGQSNADWYGVTLSKEQLAWTQSRLDVFAERASASLTDYRDLEQRYDHIVSIEMLEAVGEANWPTYFNKIKTLLKPGGRAVIQVITIADERFESYRKGADFIQRYIFPGGMLPSPAAMREQIAVAGFTLIHEEGFGADYARTLSLWSHAFEQAWPQIEALGFDARFYRMWNYYLAYCESGFKTGAIDVRFYQLSADR